MVATNCSSHLYLLERIYNMNINSIVIIFFLISGILSKILVLYFTDLKHRWLEHLAVYVIIADFIIMIAIYDYIFKWGVFF